MAPNYEAKYQAWCREHSFTYLPPPELEPNLPVKGRAQEAQFLSRGILRELLLAAGMESRQVAEIVARVSPERAAELHALPRDEMLREALQILQK